MRVARLMGFGVLAASLLAGCSNEASPVSTRAAVTVPEGQKASVFDRSRSNQALADAQAARRSGAAAQARVFAETAVNDWPASVEAWSELQADCQALADRQCRQHADFFHDKVADMSDLPPRVVVLGLQTLLEDNDPDDREQPKTARNGKASPGDSERIDDWTYAMAQRMMTFYDRQDKMAAVRDAPVERLVVDTYPPGTIAGTMMGVGAAGYAVFRAVK